MEVATRHLDSRRNGADAEPVDEPVHHREDATDEVRAGDGRFGSAGIEDRADLRRGDRALLKGERAQVAIDGLHRLRNGRS